MSLIALLDADVLVYRCGFAAESQEYKIWVNQEDAPRAVFKYKKDAKQWVKDNLSEDDTYALEKVKSVEPVENALGNVKATINSIMGALNADDYICAMSGPDNFREDIATIQPYKGNRDPDNKPVHYQALKEYIKAYHNPIIMDNVEADDTMGILQSTREDTVIVTNDKDLDMIPGDHYNFVTGERYWITEDDAWYSFYKQVLTGDGVDNIRGVPGIGEVTATKLLEGSQTKEELDNTVTAIYREHFPDDWEKQLDETMKLLWILREPLDGC